MAVDVAILEKIILATAKIDSADGTSGTAGRPIRDVLRTWEEDREALARIVPLICVRYRRAMRDAQIEREKSEKLEIDPAPRLAPPPETPPQPRWGFRHFPRPR